MKTLSCDICTESFAVSAFKEWFKQMQAHYVNQHTDVMASMAGKLKPEDDAWLAASKERFDAV